MINLITNEFEKLFSRKKTFIFLAIEFLMVFLVFITLLGNEMTKMKGFNFLNYMLNESFANILIVCFTTVFTAEIIIFEYSKGTIKQLIITPFSRISILMSKLITIILMVIIQFFIILIPSLILWLLFYRTQPLNIAFQGIVNQSLIGVLIAIALTFFLAQITKTISFSVAIPLVLFFMGNILSFSIFHSVYKYYIYYYVGVNISRLNVSDSFICIITLIYLAIFLIIPFINFKYSDIK